MRSFLILVVGLAAVQLAASKNLPSNWPACKRNDPDLKTCVRDAALIAIKEISEKGAKEFGVFPLDPMRISAIDIDQGSGPVSIELHFTDLDIYGLKGCEMGPVDVDVEKYHFHAPVSFPKGAVMKGRYRVDGKVLVLPIKGEGKAELQLENITAWVDLKGKEQIRKGVKYIGVESFDFDFETTRLKISMENLFNGNKALSENMNNFMNQNWNEILQELKPAVKQAFGSAWGDVSNRIFTKIPYDTIFPK
ncbi:hypothetical protein ONE63_007692 [Megalurothrips usitatus]|uniref:Protein takeout-like n=1 Tax=Megalurothrips usitatus TaxID=439358 RepID=A0AAV7XPJ4_9NEOP|nr:hypothetical protein ONE63_007692 [Megalurothrips usitatus]